jgi:hypothetical protein
MHWFGTAFGSLVGFVAAWMPHVFDMLNDRFNHNRDIERRQQELDAAKQGYEYAVTGHGAHLIDEVGQATLEQLQLNRMDADEVRGHAVLEFLRSSVRPVLTYSFFALFAVVKLFALYHALNIDHIAVTTLLPILWDEDTEGLFAAVISFWFGSRAVATATAQRMKAKPQVIDSLKGHNDGLPIVGE